MEWTAELKATAKAAGADLVGVANLAPFKADETILPPGALERFTKAVSVAVRLDDATVGGIERGSRRCSTRSIIGRLTPPWISSRPSL